MRREPHYDREFMKFFERMQKLVDTVDGSQEKLRKAVEVIADPFELGKMMVTLDAPVSPIKPEGEKATRYLYDWNGEVEETPFSMQLETGEGGIASAYFYLRKGVEWNEKTEAFFRMIGYCAIADMGSSRKGELLRKTVVTDLETGINNLNGYMKQGQILLNINQIDKYSSLYFNVRNFKYVNSSIGYMNGTGVLIRYARMLRDFVIGGEIVSRLGGDNFVALIQTSRLPDFLNYIQNLEMVVEHEGKKKTFLFSATCGVYEMTAGIQMMGEAMLGASMAFQKAKRTQQAIVYFTPEMLQNSLHEKEVLMKFPQAVEKGEYVAYYQPKINVEDNTITGAEVLARWNEKGELHSPFYFIQALEADGTICKLDFYMLNCACKKIRQWLDAGQEPVVLSVNFSRMHLRNAGFVEKILEILRKNQVPGKYIEIEVTETVNNEDFKTLLAAISKMKAEGIAISIDDFGTGYSSLTMLRQIPADVLKMDKSFLNDDMQERDKNLIAHIVSMAKALSMKVLAEGVETSVQRDFLRNVGCDVIQGFLYDRPLPEEEFDKRLVADFRYDV